MRGRKYYAGVAKRKGWRRGEFMIFCVRTEKGCAILKKPIKILGRKR